MLRRAALVKTESTEERIASIIRATRATKHNIPGDGILQILQSINRLDSVAETQCVSCEVGTGFCIPEDGILHRHRREKLKSYIALTGCDFKQDIMCLLWGMNWVFISQKKTSNLT
jgi:hypothetical protein